MGEKKSVLQNIKQIVDQSQVGGLFNYNDFRDCGPYSAIRSAVVELCKANYLERICQGIYVKPDKIKSHAYIPDNILLAKEIDRKNGSVATPKGDTLDYVNGVMRKMPKELQFYSTGSGRIVTLPDGTIVKFYLSKRNVK